MLNSLMAIGIGAVLGAWSRWGLASLFNQGSFPMGTLCANLLGAYLMGLAIAGFMQMPSLSNELKLLITTGFLGSLTTFSTFSAEAFNLLNRHQYTLALTHISSHVLGSIAMTFLGYVTVQYFRGH